MIERENMTVAIKKNNSDENGRVYRQDAGMRVEREF